MAEIRNEALRRNLRGNVLDGVKNYVDGVLYIHKSNFDKHIKAQSLHDWAKRKFRNFEGTVPLQAATNIERNQSLSTRALITQQQKLTMRG